MPFPKNNNANPMGRPAESMRKAKLQSEMLLEHVVRAVQVIRNNLSSKNEDVRMRAAIEVLNRVYGKPRESVEVTGNDENPLQHAVTVTISRKKPDES